MQEIDINTLIDKNNFLKKIIPDNIIIVGKIDYIIIEYKYDQLYLSNVECAEIYYKNQECNSIKDHILPKYLEILNCKNNRLTSIPDLPNELIELNCSYNKIELLPNLPNSLRYLICDKNNLYNFSSELPYSLEKLSIRDNNITFLPNLPDSLKILDCIHNQLVSLPDFT